MPVQADACSAVTNFEPPTLLNLGAMDHGWGLESPAAVERVRHTQDSHGQILALT